MFKHQKLKSQHCFFPWTSFFSRHTLSHTQKRERLTEINYVIICNLGGAQKTAGCRKLVAWSSFLLLFTETPLLIFEVKVVQHLLSASFQQLAKFYGMALTTTKLGSRNCFVSDCIFKLFCFLFFVDVNELQPLRCETVVIKTATPSVVFSLQPIMKIKYCVLNKAFKCLPSYSALFSVFLFMYLLWHTTFRTCICLFHFNVLFYPFVTKSIPLFIMF